MYRLKEIYRRGAMYWPVFWRPGRQRHARIGFDDPRAAREYGMRVMYRWFEMFGKGKL